MMTKTAIALPYGWTISPRLAACWSIDDDHALELEPIERTDDHRIRWWYPFEMHEEAPLDLGDFNVVRPLLRARLYPDDYEAGPDVVHRPVATGVIELLTIDEVTSLMLVPVNTARSWPVTADDLFRIAHDNVRADGPLEVDKELVGGINVASLSGETAYVTAHALWAGDYPVDGPYGALVVVPNQGALHTVPVSGRDVIDAIPIMVQVAWLGFQDGPRSISPNLYWWRDGTLTLAATVESRDDKLAVEMSAEFSALLDQLTHD
jgi:hypothetical protein